MGDGECERCAWRVGDGLGRGGGGRGAGAGGTGSAAAESLRHVEGIVGELEACGIPARLLDGGEMLDLLHERFCPGFDGQPVSFTHSHVLVGAAASPGCRRSTRSPAMARCCAATGRWCGCLLVDSTPVECARSRDTVKRSALGDAADYGWSASHSRCFWGFRLHGLFAPDGTPRAIALTSPKTDEREVAVKLLARCQPPSHRAPTSAGSAGRGRT